jgi:hypothetical protein
VTKGKRGLVKLAAYSQVAYYLPTGIWPLLHIRSFMKLTGPKTDVWLVKTVGVLITVVGAVIAMAARRDRVNKEIAALAVGSAAALTGIDVVYVAKGRISPIYLLDAVGELGLIGLWALARKEIKD